MDEDDSPSIDSASPLIPSDSLETVSSFLEGNLSLLLHPDSRAYLEAEDDDRPRSATRRKSPGRRDTDAAQIIPELIATIERVSLEQNEANLPLSSSSSPSNIVPLQALDSHPQSSSSDYSDEESKLDPKSPVTNYTFKNSGRRGFLTLAGICGLALVALLMVFDSFLHYHRDAFGCAPSYMRPKYVKQIEFDSERTRFAGKYALYLYREKGYDTSDEPSGIPVLFIPGNAGSYKQIRSIAAEATVQFYETIGREAGTIERGVRNLDFFTVDFNEELSALHGQSLLEQAEYLNDAVQYILSLYPQSRARSPLFPPQSLPDPTSVLIIGHSMGGIVARAMFLMSNYQHGTINTILTMSTPHVLPPATFDQAISDIYREITQYWRTGYATGAMLDVVLVSVVGGNLDEIVASDTAVIEDLVPAENGFTVFTSGVPRVWLGTDHLCILWCNQLVRVIAGVLLDVVDARRQEQTKPAKERMRAFRNGLLDGLDLRAESPQADQENFIDRQVKTLLDLNNIKHTEIQQEEPFSRSIVKPSVENPAEVDLLAIPMAGFDTFTLLTDQPLGGRFDVLLCEMMSSQRKRLSCVSVNSLAVAVPASTVQDATPFSGRVFTLLELRSHEFEKFKWIAWLDRGGYGPSGGFVSAGFSASMGRDLTLTNGVWTVLTRGLAIHHFRNRPVLSAVIHLPFFESSLLAYHLTLRQLGCPISKHGGEFFRPLVRQSVAGMYEVKWHVNVSDMDLSFHGPAPYATSRTINRLPSPLLDHRGLTLRLWTDPRCIQGVELELTLDVYGSWGKLVTRYRMVLAAFPAVVVLLGLWSQMRMWCKGEAYPHMGEAFCYIAKRVLPILLMGISALAVWQTVEPSAVIAVPDMDVSGNRTLKMMEDYIGGTRKMLGFDLIDVLIGNLDPFFWWLPGFFLVISCGVAVAVWLMVGGFVRGVVRIILTLGKMDIVPLWTLNRRQLQETHLSRLRRRLVTTVVLFVLIATLIPHQFAFIVAVLVELVTCVRAGVLSHIASDPLDRLKHRDRFHYLEGVLILLVTLLPFNLPVLMVWIRNLSVKWFVPFSSDHNIAAVAPFLVHAEVMVSTASLGRGQGGLFEKMDYKLQWTMDFFWAVMVWCGLMYGVRYTWCLSWVGATAVLWMCFLHLRSSWVVKAIGVRVKDMLKFWRKKRS
ncbi:uncharacterized protein VTP21DRAFT_7642 [Calcarisporiella thermophila]|uniref:uncharacterized protein n=1 Tax=Calcarisporiella thermophila TaxID=911321 RepID=UPI003743AE30